MRSLRLNIFHCRSNKPSEPSKPSEPEESPSEQSGGLLHFSNLDDNATRKWYNMRHEGEKRRSCQQLEHLPSPSMTCLRFESQGNTVRIPSRSYSFPMSRKSATGQTSLTSSATAPLTRATLTCRVILTTDLTARRHLREGFLWGQAPKRTSFLPLSSQDSASYPPQTHWTLNLMNLHAPTRRATVSGASIAAAGRRKR